VTAPVPKVICTEVSQSHLGQFLVFIGSILDHEPALRVYLMVIDLAPAEARPLEARIVAHLARDEALQLSVLTMDEVYGDHTDTLRFCYDPFELCLVARGGMHKWLMEQTDHDAWVHLDTDMYCLGPLDSIFAPLQQCDILLSAHRDTPCTTGEEDLVLLMYGAYNGGLLGIRRSESGRKFAAWFFDRMINYGRVDPRHPLALQPNQRFPYFGDQSWLMVVPMYFDNVHILKERGTNFGPWSLRSDETFAIDEDDGARVGTDKITILHLSGWSQQSPNLLSNYVPRDLSANFFWKSFISKYLHALKIATKEFHRPYVYANFADGTPISTYQRRAFLKLCMAKKNLDRSPFQRREAIEALAADFDTYDYYPPGLEVVLPDAAFPNMVEGNRRRATTPFLYREIPHKWYVDIRSPMSGFVSREEALILYNTAKLFAGKPALEIGCWMGWSACHLALGGVTLDIIDPILADPGMHNSVLDSLQAAGVANRCILHAEASPAAVQRIALRDGKLWSLTFIDGDHEGPHPLKDAMVAEQYADETALVLFHDLAFPDVAPALDYLRSRGWNTMVYLTMQIMGVAWRGAVNPVRHVPDPNVAWRLPQWIKNHRVSR
jgi:predicted O-methyltransferase YrrM